MTSLDFLGLVCDAIVSQYGRVATVEYPGYISIRCSDGLSWDVGTANATWGGNLSNVDTGETLDCFDTALPDTTRDHMLVAREVMACVEDLEA